MTAPSIELGLCGFPSMSQCLNPGCSRPYNPDNARFCQNCGATLLLGDRFKAMKLIGQGGFGRTFLAVDESDPDRRFCVIKQAFLAPQNAADAQKAIALFRQEAERLERLGQHPQIPQFIAHFEGAQGQFLVQEFIDGDTLESLLQDSGTFTEEEIWQVLEDLLPVLEFIHRQRVVHRDIKPENIISPVGGDRLVLVDFGASKQLTATTLATTGTVIGSAGYAAPEQAIGRPELSSDLYGLGVTCIHLMTGLHPFDLYSVSQDAWVWKDYLPAPISSRLKRVLDRLIQRATSQRYRSASEVLADLAEPPDSRRWLSPAPGVPGALVGTGATRSRSPGSLASQKSWRYRATLAGHNGTVTAIAISPDSSLIASGSLDKSIKLWHLESGELLHTFSGRSLWFGAGHTGQISALAFAAEGTLLISGSDDGLIKLWNLPDRQLQETLPGQGWGITAIAPNADGTRLYSGGGDGLISLWDLTQSKVLTTLRQHRDRISTLHLSPDEQTLVSGSHDGTIRLWNTRTRSLVGTLRGHNDPISAIAISPNWQVLFSGSWDRTLKLWDLTHGTLLKALNAHSDRLSCLAIHPTGDYLASGSDDSRIKLWALEWDNATGELTRASRDRTLPHQWSISALCFSPNGRYLISASADETIKIWEMNATVAPP